MNPIPDNIMKLANEAAIYNLYLYLVHIKTPKDSTPLRNIIMSLSNDYKNPKKHNWSNREIYRLNIINNAIKANPILGDSLINNLTISKKGLNACSFTNKYGEVFITFRGTGKGEWIDNGEGLSGIPEYNTYKNYSPDGTINNIKSVINDYATDQQVEALNWFKKIVAKNNWDKATPLILSGHSKGGNKAQFITISSDLADYCFSFSGQGFSPEALNDLKNRYEAYENRRQKIYSFSTDNDYVNVLGKRIMPENQIYYFSSRSGFHYLESMLTSIGKFTKQTEQGKISEFVESISEKLMTMAPEIRKYATLGVMNIFQNFLGNSAPINGDKVTVEQTIIGMGIAIDIFLSQLKNK